jgi:hypothetical protein
MRLFLLWTATFVALAAACSGSTTTTTASPQEACTDLATSICNRLEACYPYAMTVAYGSTATCVTRAAIGCPSAVTATGSVATAADIEACAQAYSAATCDALLDNGAPAACQIAGTLAAGTPCGSDLQCAGSDGYCKPTTGSCGVCSSRAALGGACGANDDCQRGFVCATSATPATCVTPGAAGATCSTAQPCVASLACVNGTCGTPIAAGATCTPAAADACDAPGGYYCSAAGVCTQVQTAAAGAACGESTTGITECAEGTCKPVTGTTMGTCQAPAADGAACDATNGPGCLTPAVCINSACTIPNPASCD